MSAGPTQWRTVIAIVLVVGSVCACTGQIGDRSAGASGGNIVTRQPDQVDGGGMQLPPSMTSACVTKIDPGRAPLRRLTRFEYNNSVLDMLSDTTSPGSELPSEVLASTFDLFGNNADAQSVSWPLVKAYSSTAAEIAARATASASVMAKLHVCTHSITAANQDACARMVISSFAGLAYRRDATASEVDDLFALYKEFSSPFATGIATVIEAVLQSPDFLYRLEWGVPDAAHPGTLRPTAAEMATRLSYTLWATTPDEALRTAAKTGELDSADGVRMQATRLINDQRAHAVVRFFFDKLLPIEGLSDITRDTTLYSSFSPAIGAYMHEETQHFVEAEIFDNNASWDAMLTAPYTYVNAPLAKYYGLSGVTGDDKTYQKAALDPTQRIGLLMQGGVMTGTIPTNTSNPVRRGGFVLNALLCRHLSLPTDPAILAKVKVPEVDGHTARERFTQHSAQAVCHTCHQFLDPVGFALENFDAVGLYRDKDNGYTIDASGTLQGVGSFKNGVELAQRLAAADETHACFVSHWIEFAYGHLLDKTQDACVAERLTQAFKASGYNVKQLLVDLTQSDAFLYLPTAADGVTKKE